MTPTLEILATNLRKTVPTLITCMKKRFFTCLLPGSFFNVENWPCGSFSTLRTDPANNSTLHFDKRRR